MRRFRPLLGRLAFDVCDLIEREELFALNRQSYGPGNFLPGPQAMLLNEGTRNGYVLGHRQKIQFGPAQHRKGTAHLVEKTLCGNRSAAGQCGADNIEDVVMARASGMQIQIQITRQCF